MKRFKVLFGQRRMQVLLTLGALLLAVSVVIGSGANFTSSAANPGNVFTSGSLKVGDYTADGVTNNDTKPIVDVLTSNNMKPGDVVTGTAVIKNDGTTSGLFTLTGALTGDTAGLGNYLTLKIVEDPSNANRTIFNGKINTLGSAISLTQGAAWLGGATHTYVFTVSYPNGAPGTENTYMGKSVTAAFTWNAVGS